jgi:hypothetical protein
MGMLLLAPAPSFAQTAPSTAAAGSPCLGDNGGITLPSGFCATVFADQIDHARQMAFGPNGVLYVNTWSGTYFRNDTPPPGGFLVALQDTKGEGRADAVTRFGPGPDRRNAGGTGIALYNGGLYAETIASCATHCRRAQLRRIGRPRSLSPGCRSPAITRCIRSESMRMANYMSTSVRRPIPARLKTACRTRPAESHAPNSRRAAASGAMTQTRLCRALRYRLAQRRRHRIRFRRANVCDHARSRPAARELAAPLHTRKRRQ